MYIRLLTICNHACTCIQTLSYPSDMPVWEHALLGHLEHLPCASFQRTQSRTMARRNGTSTLVNMAPANTQYMQKLMLLITKTLDAYIQLGNQLKSLSTYTNIAMSCMRIYGSSGCQLCYIYHKGNCLSIS